MCKATYASELFGNDTLGSSKLMLRSSTAGSLILQMSHGYVVQEGSDPYVDLVELAVDQFSQVSRAGAFMVDFVPSLRYLPSWFPGATFKRQAISWRETLDQMVNIPYNYVKRRMASLPPLLIARRLTSGCVLRTKTQTYRTTRQIFWKERSW